VHVLALTLSLEPAAIAVGGTQAITDALVKAGERRGVEYHTHDAVTEILTANGRAQGVRLASGATVSCDLVVSNSLNCWRTIAADLGIDADACPAAASTFAAH
jgi:beta-carotene ketolase (CrtO type)